MKISQISKNLGQIGAYYSVKPDSGGKQFSFYKAARKLIEVLGKDFEVEVGYDFTVIDGIGPGIQERITRMLKGEYIQELEEHPDDNKILGTLSQAEKETLRDLQIKSDSDLYAAATNSELAEFLPDEIINLLGRQRTEDFLPLVTLIADSKYIYCTGSFRRKLPTIKDLDFIVVASDDHTADSILNELFEHLKPTITFTPVNNGEVMRRYIVSYKNLSIGVDFKVVRSASIGTALLHFTGPVSRNISCRSAVKKYGYTLNEYGLFNSDNINLTKYLSEQEVIEKLYELFKIIVPINPKDR